MSPKKKTRRTRPDDTLGFTLVEVLVILAIIAVLAGVLVPVVTNQIRKAETARVTSDVTGIRTGIEAFIADVKRYPGDLDDLSSPVDGSDNDINLESYPAGLANSWSGPYIDRVMLDADSLETGFGGQILDSMQTWTHPGNSVDYITVLITGISSGDFDEVDAAIDGGDGATAGRLLFFDGVADPDTTKFLAIPIN